MNIEYYFIITAFANWTYFSMRKNKKIIYRNLLNLVILKFNIYLSLIKLNAFTQHDKPLNIIFKSTLT